MHIRKERLDIQIVGIDGTTTRVTQAVHLPILTKYGIRQFPFAVVKPEDMPFCLFLGANYLRATHAKLDFRTATLMHHEKSKSLEKIAPVLMVECDPEECRGYSDPPTVY